MLETLFLEKRKYIDHFFEQLDIEAAEKFLSYLKACEGLIVLTGVGKSGIVAKKIAVTMTSTGTRALYLSPTDALHGDLGIITSKDTFVFLSKSGESEELLSIIPYLRNKGICILGLVSNGRSRLAKACDFAVVLPLEKELCPYNMAPTTSTAIQLIFGDVMAVALMRARDFSLDQYVMNHPAGSIGKRNTLKVKDLMMTDSMLPLCSPETQLIDVLVELSNKRSGCILIVDQQMTLQGIFTDGDLSRILVTQGPDGLQKPVSHHMTKTPRTINPDCLAVEAMKQMESSQKSAITCMPVTVDRKLLGLIRLHDIIQSGISSS